MNILYHTFKNLSIGGRGKNRTCGYRFIRTVPSPLGYSPIGRQFSLPYLKFSNCKILSNFLQVVSTALLTVGTIIFISLSASAKPFASAREIE